MQRIKQIIQRIFPYLVFVTLFSIPFQIRKVVFPVFESGYFHETLSMSIYFTDILIILCIICGLFLFYVDWMRIFTRIERGIYKNPLFWLALFIFWQYIILFRADNIGVAAFRIFKIIEMILFGIILYLSLSNTEYLMSNTSDNKNKKNCFLFLCLGSTRFDSESRRAADSRRVVSCFLITQGIIQSIWAILQFIFQKSLGLVFLKESVLSPFIPGVAKIIINGQKYIRAYGGFPHPNILAGFLVVSILCTIITLLSCKDYTKLTLVLPSHYTKVTLILKIALILQIAGLIFTGSISGFSSLILGSCTIITLLLCKDYTKLTLVLPSHYTKVTLILIILLLFGLFGGLFYLRSEDLIQNKNSISERMGQYKVSGEILRVKPNILFGVGPGNYVDYLMRNGCKNTKFCVSSEMQPWEKQPVHNVFALILVENGGVGLLLFLIFFILLAWQNPLVISLLPILCFDHYLWTMQQGILIFILMIIISIVYKKLNIETVKQKMKI